MVSNAIAVSATPAGCKIAVAQLKELDCQGCVDNIRWVIGNCDGVLSVRASVATRQVTVEYEFPFTEEILARKLEFAKFELAEPVKLQLEVVENVPQAVPA